MLKPRFLLSYILLLFAWELLWKGMTLCWRIKRQEWWKKDHDFLLNLASSIIPIFRPWVYIYFPHHRLDYQTLLKLFIIVVSGAVILDMLSIKSVMMISLLCFLISLCSHNLLSTSCAKHTLSSFHFFVYFLTIASYTLMFCVFNIGKIHNNIQTWHYFPHHISSFLSKYIDIILDMVTVESVESVKSFKSVKSLMISL